MTGPEDRKNPLAWKRVGKFFLDWVKCLGSYALVVAAGTLLFLIGSSIVGYLAYSDRPGPGWGQGVFSWSEVKFFVGWLPLLFNFLLYLGAVLFPFARLLGWFQAPRWVVRVFGGLLSGISGLVGVLAAGWYIAISQYPVYAGAISGIIYGACLLPHFSGLPRGGPRSWKQWAGTTTTIIACGAFVVYPLAPKQPEQSLQLLFVRVIAGPQELNGFSIDGGLTVDELNQLKALGITGTLQYGMSGGRGSSPARARAVIVCTGELRSPVALREPKATHVLYVQQGSAWNMYPPSAPTIRSEIKLSPSAKDPRMIEVRFGSSSRAFPGCPPDDH
jgi:hypothetical protein